MSWWEENWGATYPQGVTLSVVIPVFNERYLVEELVDRVLSVSVPGVSDMELVVVDDGSTDGTSEILERLAVGHPDRIVLLHQSNSGKGAAVRAGIARASGELIVIQDADLEYDPRDFTAMVRPFWENGADVVYGSRFAASSRRRVLYFRHTMGNRILTFLSNLFTDLNLTDVETCYKMFRAPLLKSIPIRSTDFAMEIELTAKIAKRGCRVFEVPISYAGRTYHEGKKITWRDGLKALVAVLKFWVVDDLYQEDPYGAEILHSLERANEVNRWVADTIRPWVGARVLEIGAGIGNITQWLLPRELYLASDINTNYLHYLRNFAAGKPYLEVARIDLDVSATFAGHKERFDTVVCLNVLEHVPDPAAALVNIHSALEDGGRLVLYVPRGASLYSSLDAALGHRCRYELDELTAELETAGFEIEHVETFNRLGVLGWWWNGRILKKRHLSRIQLKLFDMVVPLVRRIDRFLPWRGLGLIAAARKPSTAVAEHDGSAAAVGASRSA